MRRWCPKDCCPKWILFCLVVWDWLTLPIYAIILLNQNEDLCRITGVAKASVVVSSLQLPCLVLFGCLWLILYALCGDEDTRMKHYDKLKRLDGVMYQVAGIAMMVIFFGLPGARISVAFAAWGTFDSCPEVLVLGDKVEHGRRRQQTVAEARENDSSVTISGPVWNVFVVLTAAAYVWALCLVFYPCVARHIRDSKAKFELERSRAGSPQEDGTVEQPPPNPSSSDHQEEYQEASV